MRGRTLFLDASLLSVYTARYTFFGFYIHLFDCAEIGLFKAWLIVLSLSMESEVNLGEIGILLGPGRSLSCTSVLFKKGYIQEEF